MRVMGLAENVPEWRHDIAVAVGVHDAHDLGAACHRTDGESAADDLAERGEVGGEAVVLLRAAVAVAKGHHLIGDQQRLVAGSPSPVGRSHIRVRQSTARRGAA